MSEEQDCRDRPMRRLAEQEDRQAWIGRVKRRLGLVDEVHRCWVWRGSDKWWHWWCQRDLCYAGEGPLYGSQPDALHDALAHARAYLPGPPEETPVTELDLMAFDALWAGMRGERDAFAAALPGRMNAAAELLSEGLPEGMRFEWE